MQRKSRNNKNTRYIKPGICKSYLRSLASKHIFCIEHGSDRKITSKQEKIETGLERQEFNEIQNQ